MRAFTALTVAGMLVVGCVVVRDLDQYESGGETGGATSTGGSGGAGGTTSTGGESGEGGTTSGGGGGTAGAASCNPPCSGSADICNPQTLQCVQCLSGSDCSSSHPVCAPNGTCVDCLGDGDCSSPTPLCLNNDCVECKSTSDCTGGDKCHSGSHKCQPPCTSDPDCTSAPLVHCLTSQGICVQCLSSADCSGSQKCSSSSNTCFDD